MSYLSVDPRFIKDTREGIFKEKFLCLLRYIDTLSEAEIRRSGVPTTYVEELDEAHLNHPVRQYLTIDDMIELYRRGITIRVVNYEDTEKIYDNIQEHLLAWKRDIERSHSTNHVPVEDLIDLDRFANVVYKKAKFVFDQAEVQDYFVKGIDNVFALSALFAAEEDTPKRIGGEIKYPERVSLEELFLNLKK